MSNFNFLISSENKYPDALDDLKKAEISIDKPIDAYMFLRRGVEQFFFQYKEYDKNYKYSLNKILKNQRNNSNNRNVKPVLRIYIEAFSSNDSNLKALKDRCNPATHGGLTKKQKSELSKKENLVTDFNSFIKVASKIIKISAKKFDKNAIPKNNVKPNREEIDRVKAEFQKIDEENEKNKEEIEKIKFESKQKDKKIIQKDEVIAQIKIELAKNDDHLAEEKSTRADMLKNAAYYTQRDSANKVIYELRNSAVHLKNAAYTEPYSDLGPSFFINFRIENENWYIVRHEFNESIWVAKGTFQEDLLFTMHPSKKEIEETSTNDDFSSIEDEGLRNKFIALKRSIFEKLRIEFTYTGSYYYNSSLGNTRTMYRNLLEINSTNATESSKYDALIIMMNPGGSKPHSIDLVSDKEFKDSDKTQLIDCQPDVTQYQIVKVMVDQGWDRVAVINTLDTCDPRSDVVIDSLFDENGNRIKGALLNSIFHKDRRKELNLITNNLTKVAPVIIGWGVDKKWWNGEPPLEYTDSQIKIATEFDDIRNKIYERIIKPLSRNILGDKKKACYYYHPWPRTEERRKEWPHKIIEQLNN